MATEPGPETASATAAATATGPAVDVAAAGGDDLPLTKAGGRMYPAFDSAMGPLLSTENEVLATALPEIAVSSPMATREMSSPWSDSLRFSVSD